MFKRIFGGDESTDLGPEHIIDAVYGNQSVTDADVAVMETPRLRDFGTEYFTDYYVVIPLSVATDVEMAPFVFNIPEDPALDGVLGELAGFYGVEAVEDIADLAGNEVPVEWPEGYPQPALNELRAENAE